MALPIVSARSSESAGKLAVTGYRIVLKERYPYPPALRKRISGRLYPTPGAAIKAFGRRHHPYQLMPISISEAKEKPVQVRSNVGVKSQQPAQQ